MTQSQDRATPFHTKLAMVLVSLIAISYICILGKKILSPLIFSFLFAIVLLPVCNFFERRRIPRSASAGLAVIFLIGFIALILFIVGSQLTKLTNDWPLFKEQFSLTFEKLQDWIGLTFHVNMKKQMDYLHTATTKMMSSSTTIIGETVLSLSSMLLFLVFVMIDTFFLLFYRRLIVKFLIAVFKEENSQTVFDVIEQVQYIIRKYILGLLLEMAIVAGVCCLAFTIIGIKYSILLGLITGLLNIIPYIGIFTSLVLSVIITIGTAATSTKLILVVVTIVGMHLIDSNYLLPVIVGSKVKINALITLLGVIIGEMFWGIPGMFLSIPIIAIAKVIFDRVDTLKPWGLLLGDEKDEEYADGKIARSSDTLIAEAEVIKSNDTKGSSINE